MLGPSFICARPPGGLVPLGGGPSEEGGRAGSAAAGRSVPGTWTPRWFCMDGAGACAEGAECRSSDWACTGPQAVNRTHKPNAPAVVTWTISARGRTVSIGGSGLSWAKCEEGGSCRDLFVCRTTAMLYRTTMMRRVFRNCSPSARRR